MTERNTPKKTVSSEVEKLYELGCDYQKGNNQREKNAYKALEYFLQAARKGHLDAQFQSGVAYVHGWGTQRDYSKGVFWLEKAAHEGHASAQDSLGVRYATGQGVERNDDQALTWFMRAANQGHVVAQFNLATLYLHGQGVAQDYKLAYVWFMLSSEGGDPFGEESAKSVAEALSPHDLIKARVLLREAKHAIKGE